MKRIAEERMKEGRGGKIVEKNKYSEKVEGPLFPLRELRDSLKAYNLISLIGHKL